MKDLFLKYPNIKKFLILLFFPLLQGCPTGTDAITVICCYGTSNINCYQSATTSYTGICTRKTSTSGNTSFGLTMGVCYGPPQSTWCNTTDITNLCQGDWTITAVINGITNIQKCTLGSSSIQTPYWEYCNGSFKSFSVK